MASRKVAALLAASLFVLPTSQALSAPISRCVLEVNGKTYLDGPCDYHRGQTGGSFELRTTNYYAYVDIGAALVPEIEHPSGALGGDETADRPGAPPPKFILGDMAYYAHGYWGGRGSVDDLGKMKREGVLDKRHRSDLRLSLESRGVTYLPSWRGGLPPTSAIVWP